MRYASIDLLRTVAIVLMVLVHFLENLAGAMWTPAGFGAPLFAFLAGMSFRIWVRSQERKGEPDSAITRTAVRRGLFLFALGFAFNVLVWLPEDTYNWDVLTMIGTVLIFLGFARHLPSVVLACIAGMFVVLSPFLQFEAGYHLYWEERYFQCDWTLSEVTIGYLATGYFPLFPWAALPIVGYLAGLVLFADGTDAKSPSIRPLIVSGCAMVLLAVGFQIGKWVLPPPVSTRLFTGWTMFPASLEYVCGTLGGALLGIALLHVWVDRRNSLATVPAVLSVAGTMSRHSLSMYLLHHLLHIWPLWLVGLFAGTETTAYWREATPEWVSIVLVLPCLLVCYLLFLATERWKLPTVESFMRWLCG